MGTGFIWSRKGSDDDSYNEDNELSDPSAEGSSGHVSSGLFIQTAGSKYALRYFIMFFQQIHYVC
jgi:hypothetical protein